MIYLDLILNLALLVALTIISGFVDQRWPRRTRSGVLMQGTLFGAAAVIGMLRPLNLGPGLIFDGRSVMVSLCALFFGPWAALVSGALVAACRVWMGGVGMVTGGLVVVSSVGIGLLAYIRRPPDAAPPSVRSLYLFGLAVHVAMVALMFTLPGDAGWTVVKRIGPPVLLLYPLATILAGKILSDQLAARRSLEALKESGERLRIVSDNLPGGMVYQLDMGADGRQRRFSYVSEGVKRLHGLTVAEALKDATKIYGQIVEADRALVAEQEAGAASTMTPFHAEVRVRMPTGEIRWRLFTSAPRLLPNNHIVWDGLELDVTDRKRAEEELSNTKILLEQAFEQSPVPMVLVSMPDAIIRIINPAGLEFLGMTDDPSYLGTPLLDFKPTFQDYDRAGNPGDVKDLPLARALQGQKTVNEERIIFRKDGTIRRAWVNGVPIYNSLGDIIAGYLIMIDITGRQKAEAERERLMTAIEQTGEIILITDPAGIIQYVNPAFEAVTGYTREETIGQTPRMLKSGSHDEAFYRELWKTIAGGKTWHGRFFNKRKNGSIYTEEAAISPVCDPTGRIVNYVGVKRDITEHLRLTEHFQQAQKMESIGRLAGGVAHDFNNMLQTILGNVELAMTQVDPAQPPFNELQDIYKAAQHSTTLTRQLLAFARKQTVAPKVLDLNETLEGMLKILRRLMGEDIDLAWRPGAGLWPVKVDPSQLDQILANLCVNARDAIEGVGKVTIETGNAILDEAYCLVHPGTVPGRYAMLAVSDDGCGMDRETLARLFEPFFTTKAAGEGTGLGLAMIYGIVNQNNGFINVYSEPGSGSIFKIYLPACSDAADRPGRGGQDAEGAGEIHKGRGVTVLLVEDDPSILVLTATMLKKQGYTVLTANNPDEAIGIVGRHAGDIHLLITDVVLPGMNGRDLAHKLQASRPAMKCLFTSGYTANVIAHRGVLDEGTYFIQKPFSIKELADKVHEALDA